MNAPAGLVPRPGVRAVVWDMDGTLIDSSSAVPDAFIATVSRLGGGQHSREAIVRSYFLGPPRTMLSALLGRSCSDADIEVYHDILREGSRDVRPYPGIADVLSVLSDALPLAVFTGASARAAEILLSVAGLSAYFAAVVGGDQVARPKPHPDGIFAACERLGVPPADVVYVGDSPADTLAARRAGAMGMAAAWGHLHDPAAEADAHLAHPAALIDVVRT